MYVCTILKLTMVITLIILVHRDCVKRMLVIQDEYKSGIVDKLIAMGHYEEFLT